MTDPNLQELPAISTKPSRILLVDDDEINRDLFTAVLLNRNYEIVPVSNGFKALEKLAEGKFDIVLLDIMMAGMDGYEVLTKMRSDPKTKSIPVIMISALADPRDVVKGLDLGANDYVTKPIEPSILRARVSTQIRIKQLSDERLQQIDKLQQAENIRNQLSRIATHDLKNPLHNIRVAHHLLQEDLQSNQRTQKILDTIALSVNTMQHVIETFMDMVAIQSGTLRIKNDIIAVRDILMNVITQYEVSAEKKNIQLQWEGLEGHVRADNGRMVQIVGNLVSNAVKYSPHGTQVKIWSERQDKQVRICVRDQGPGIPQAERHLLFQEFSKLSTRPTGDESSTGLGLWIVKHLMQVQGGDAGAHFPDDGGSVFWVELPYDSGDLVLS